MLFDEAEKCSLCPRLTGIPPHVTLLNQMALLQEKIEESTNGLVNAMRLELNARGIGGETFLANEVLDDVRKLHKDMAAMITLNKNGGAVGGGSGIGNILPVPAVPQPEVPLLIEQTGGRGHRTMYCWGGQLHNVPENFEMPRMTLQTLITYWYCGSTQPAIPPLCYARAYDFDKKKKMSMRTRLCQMKRMINKVHTAGEMVGFNFDLSQQWTTVRATRLYEMIKHLFELPPVKHRRRYESISWKIYHNVLVKNDWKLVGEE